MRASVLENESFPSIEISMETSISVFYALETHPFQNKMNTSKSIRLVHFTDLNGIISGLPSQYV